VKTSKSSDFYSLLDDTKTYYTYLEYSSSSSCSGTVDTYYAVRNGACVLSDGYIFKYPDTYKSFENKDCTGGIASETSVPTGCYSGVEYAWYTATA
jgi:hypothetical protein